MPCKPSPATRASTAKISREPCQSILAHALAPPRFRSGAASTACTINAMTSERPSAQVAPSMGHVPSMRHVSSSANQASFSISHLNQSPSRATCTSGAHPPPAHSTSAQSVHQKYHSQHKRSTISASHRCPLHRRALRQASPPRARQGRGRGETFCGAGGARSALARRSRCAANALLALELLHLVVLLDQLLPELRGLLLGRRGLLLSRRNLRLRR